ncbi:Serine/threonine-protein kinase PrkC [Stieleria neptunia]|uniref:Serine/threonine-protein kinase PrkC n=1 Tax=Stieleria neptunia TaxID=2527979 RepID=A0A518HYN6_9BACT|nr:bifunctional serine/threonine-protein kinase/formylglycine-generating enzyme family protein [Stieleria neptunia]QDV45963.1 Serine/threonine-protein kinase PrkC [Stieleria neptunia]
MSSDDILSLSAEERIDRIADAFESKFESGSNASIEQFLDGCPSDERDTLLTELLTTEIQIRHQRGDWINFNEYHTRFPGDTKIVAEAIRNASVAARPPQVEHAGKSPVENDLHSIGRFHIIECVGGGGFGRVCRAVDPRLNRVVAVKLPHLAGKITGATIDVFLREARSAARLNHPSIVTVYEAFEENGIPAIVYEYVQGQDLSTWAKSRKLSARRAMEIIDEIAAGVAHAHQRGVIHCDLKLANVLIDHSGTPRVTDFGLAISESFQQRSMGSRVGTPISMSPEQIRGDDRIIDERTDVWGLGVMLYELLTGGRPFVAPTTNELFEKISNQKIQIPFPNATEIPTSVQKLCACCLAKHPDDRFDCVDDLRAAITRCLEELSLDSPELGPDGDLIYPGLRCFTDRDANGFRELLPLPGEQNGNAPSIQGWVSLLEGSAKQKDFCVGLIYGPSGSGKSSLVRAGFLPALDLNRVLPVYLVASQNDTETALTRRLRRAMPGHEHHTSLPELLASVRDSDPARKLLIVIDQFERWLISDRSHIDPVLVKGFQQCDGSRVQALLIVRDDFFSSVNQLFQTLDQPLAEGKNYWLIQPFTPRHARRVLTRLGQALGKLSTQVSSSQSRFLDQAVATLSQQEGISAVRIAMFTQMMADKPWESDSIAQVGGLDGLGVSFLNDVLALEKTGLSVAEDLALCRIMGSLLPDSDTADLSGAARPVEFLEVVTRGLYRKSFQRILTLLDDKLKLITAVELGEDSSDEGSVSGRPAYQLAHDYLVPAIRKWLTAKQLETRRGRAERKLKELSVAWQRRRENRFLPSLIEYSGIVLFSERSIWSQDDIALMVKASRRHFVRLAGMATLLLCAYGMFGHFERRRNREQLIQRLIDADIHHLPRISREFEKQGIHFDDPSIGLILNGMASDEIKLKFGLVFLGRSDQAEPLIRDSVFAVAGPQNLPAISELIATRHNRLARFFQNTIVDETSEPSNFLIASGLLARIGGDDAAIWDSVANRLASELTNQNAITLPVWEKIYRPIRHHLAEALTQIYRNTAGDYLPSQVAVATDLLAVYAVDDTELLCELVLDADPGQFRKLIGPLRRRGSRARDRFLAELKHPRKYYWSADEIDHRDVDPELHSALERADGMVTKDFAICQTMTRRQFDSIHPQLEQLGFRATRVRPYRDAAATRVAAIWRRDALPATVELGLDRRLLRERFIIYQFNGFQLSDVAGYTVETDRGVIERFAVVWSRQPPGGSGEQDFYAGVSEAERWRRERTLIDRRFKRTVSVHAYNGPDGDIRYCGVQQMAAGLPTVETSLHSTALAEHEDRVRLTCDICVSMTPESLSSRSYWQQRRDDWGNSETRDIYLQEERFRFELGRADFYLGNDAESLRNLDEYIKRRRHHREAYRLRALLHARGGRRRESLDDLWMLERLDEPERRLVATKILVSAHLAMDRWPVTMIEPSAEQESDVAVLLDAAGVYARSAGIIRSRDNESARRWAARSIQLLRQAMRAGFEDATRLRLDWMFDPIRTSPEFIQLQQELPPGVVYTRFRSSGMWADEKIFQGKLVGEHTADFKVVAREHYRPNSISVTDIAGRFTAASVWRRRRDATRTPESFEPRKANAVVALYCLRELNSVWNVLESSDSPGIRTEVIAKLGPFGCNPSPILDRLASETDTGARHAMILALGHFSLSHRQQSRLLDQLEHWYVNDPDPGMHGAIDWLLRRLGYESEVQQLDATLADGKIHPQRDWFATRHQGHVLAIIRGPVRFMQGTPRKFLSPTNARWESQAPTRINRSFAMATKEVTVAQFLEFLADLPRPMNRLPDGINKDPKCAVAKANWMTAMLYCKWLSEKEGIPEDQHCFPTIPEEKYQEPVELPHDYLRRTGYRLPTQSEFEFAARGGTTTHRFFGNSDNLLHQYAWHLDNAPHYASRVGLLKPNAYGLFDVLGNLREWGIETSYSRHGLGPKGDDVEDLTKIHPTIPQKRVANNASFQRIARSVYGSKTGSSTPYNFGVTMGFRIARTIEDFRPPAIDGE